MEFSMNFEILSTLNEILRRYSLFQGQATATKDDSTYHDHHHRVVEGDDEPKETNTSKSNLPTPTIQARSVQGTIYQESPSAHKPNKRAMSSGKLPRPSTPPGLPPASALRRPSRLSFGTVCSSNINRSMEAHCVLQNAGLRVESYGTGSQVRLPGKSAMEPKIFKFGTPYATIYNSLYVDDPDYFRRNGVLALCERGAAVKKAPRRWQDVPTDDVLEHQVVICFEERIYDAVLEDLQLREPTENFSPILVICLDTKDNPHEAAIQGQVCLDLCWKLEHACFDLQVQGAEILEEFQEQRKSVTPVQILYQLCYL